ncbi:hypothetical protein [Cryobacterium sp. TMT2-23]|uniref:hypothetical protein n=1 Tax=Cryobacterium sp. TMT2-23 TaxID=1259252 RepID=UPI001069C234|nr:hypothetical protein [Cryobacterium sp. TMT2-23]TFD15770.1 hypothetical protein E3T32_16305 [Cryobacterium sp. TMT2-23]
MTENIFDVDHTAKSLIELSKSLVAVGFEMKEARRVGSPDLAELVSEFYAAQFARGSFLQDLDNTPGDAVWVVYALAVRLAEDLRSVMRDAAALYNTGNAGAAAMLSARYLMIVPDHEVAARLARVAEQRVKSPGGPNDNHGESISRELVAIASTHLHHLQPVIMSLTDAIVAREAIRNGAL